MAKSQITDRLFLCAFTLTLVLLALVEDQSVSYALLRRAGVAAVAAAVVLVMCAVVALLDTVVNDMFPERWSFDTGLRARRGLWMVLAVALCIQCFVLVRVSSGIGYWVPFIYFLCSARCAAVAFIDLHREFIARTRRRRASDGKEACQ